MEKKKTSSKKITTSKKISSGSLNPNSKHKNPRTWDDVEERDGSKKKEAEKTAIETTKWSKKHPSRMPENEIYTARWNLYVEDICERPNFKKGHLFQLDVLCKLYVDLANVERILAEEGLTYSVIGRNGAQIKPRPELTQKNAIVGQIHAYSKMLGLLLVKDKKFTGEEEDEWD